MIVDILGPYAGDPLLAMLGLILILVATWIFLRTRQQRRVKTTPSPKERPDEMDVLGMPKKTATNSEEFDTLSKAINIRVVILILLLIAGLLLIYYGSTGYKEITSTPRDTEINRSFE